MYTAELSTGDMSLLVYLTLPQVFSWQQVVIQSPALTTLKASSFLVYSWLSTSFYVQYFTIHSNMKFHIYCKMTPPITVSRKIDPVLFTKFQNIEIVHWYQHWNLLLIKPFQLDDSNVFKWCIFFLIVNKLKQWNQYTVLTTQIYFLFTLQNTNTIKVFF